MNKCLQEVSISTVRVYGERAQKFMIESRSAPFLLSELLAETVSSEFGKIAIQLWPPGQMTAKDINPILRDTVSDVLVVEMEYDVESFYRCTDTAGKVSEIKKLFETALETVPQDVSLDREQFLMRLSEAEQLGFRYYSLVGDPVADPGSRFMIQLFSQFDSTEISLGVVVLGENGNEIFRSAIANYPAFDIGAIYEVGSIRFVDKDTIVYEPKTLYEPITLRIDLDEEVIQAIDQ